MPGNDETSPERAPHRDPTEWGKLVESLDVASIFVVIGSWQSARLRGEVSPEDIWQDALWCSWRDREQHEWSNLASWRSWLLGIAKNRVRDAGRALGRQKRGGNHNTAPFSMLTNGSVSSLLPPGSTTPSRVAGFRERAHAMETALDSLDADLQAIVRLRLFEEIPIRDVAQQLQIPLSTAKERLLRGVTRYRQRLRQLLGSDGSESGP